jgi:hypothetical protein
MEQAAGKPLMFKNNTWFTFQASWLAHHVPNSILVACSRDPFFTAQSIYIQRQELGDRGKWWSMRPSSYRDLLDLSPLEQVAAQAVDIQRGMEEALSNVPATRLVRADYNRVCENPRGLVDSILNACAQVAPLHRTANEIPERFDAADKRRLPPDEAERLRQLVNERLASTQL